MVIKKRKAALKIPKKPVDRPIQVSGSRHPGNSTSARLQGSTFTTDYREVLQRIQRTSIRWNETEIEKDTTTIDGSIWDKAYERTMRNYIRLRLYASINWMEQLILTWRPEAWSLKAEATLNVTVEMLKIEQFLRPVGIISGIMCIVGAEVCTVGLSTRRLAFQKCPTVERLRSSSTFDITCRPKDRIELQYTHCSYPVAEPGAWSDLAKLVKCPLKISSGYSSYYSLFHWCWVPRDSVNCGFFCDRLSGWFRYSGAESNGTNITNTYIQMLQSTQKWLMIIESVQTKGISLQKFGTSFPFLGSWIKYNRFKLRGTQVLLRLIYWFVQFIVLCRIASIESWVYENH